MSGGAAAGVGNGSRGGSAGGLGAYGAGGLETVVERPGDSYAADFDEPERGPEPEASMAAAEPSAAPGAAGAEDEDVYEEEEEVAEED